jgi:hypothetical protein
MNMRQANWTRCSIALLGVALLAWTQAGRADDKDKPKKVTVKKILEITYTLTKSEPTKLVVRAVGQVPTGGFTNVKLTRVKHTKPPKDGIQEYVLTAVPPSGIASQIVSKVKAEDTWKGYKKAAPWIKGVRVKGVGNGVLVKKFEKGK